MSILTLRPYQIGDLARYIANPRYLNLSDPGTGKTPSVCVYAQYLWEYEKAKTVWAMPKSLLKKNREELLRFTNLRPEQVVIVDGTPAERDKQLADPHAVVSLMGFTRFATDWRRIKRENPQYRGLFVDEFHMGFKRHDSQRTTQLFLAAPRFDFFLGMTGTIIGGDISTAYPAIKVVEPRYYMTYFTFMQHHAIEDFDGNIIGWMNHDKLYAILDRHSVRHTFEEIFGEQEIITQFQVCDLAPRQRKAYDDMHESAMVELEDRFLTAANSGVAAIRARQIMQCPEIFEGLTNEKLEKDERLRVILHDHLDRQEPLIIFSTFIPEQNRIKRLCDEVGLRARIINSEVSASERGDIDDDFCNGRIDAVIASTETAAVGFNWGHVDHIVFASLNYQDDSYVQGIQRAIRGTREQPLRITILVYRDTIDERILSIVDSKRGQANLVDLTYRQLNLYGLYRDTVMDLRS